MGAGSCDHEHHPAPSEPGRGTHGVLWIALAVNAAMFAIEIAAGLSAGSSALRADALDFLADAANYAFSLAVLGMGLWWRAHAARVKAASMGVWASG